MQLVFTVYNQATMIISWWWVKGHLQRLNFPLTEYVLLPDIVENLTPTEKLDDI